MNSAATDRSACRLCGSANLVTAIDIGKSPLGDDFVFMEELDRPQPEFDVRLMLCLACGQVQLSQVINPDTIYKRYTYLTSVSHGLVEHFQRYADTVMARFKKPGFVVEIGSNEGAMLRHFKTCGWQVLGIDPAIRIARTATENGIETWPMYFSKTAAIGVKKTHGQAQLVIANNVIANIDNLDDVIDGVKELLAPDGLFIFETSYLLDVVERKLLDTIFHEHVSYFSVNPLRNFFSRHGLKLIDAERTTPKGGSLRCTAQLANGLRQVSTSVCELKKLEEQAGIFQLNAYYKLAINLETLKRDLQGVVLQAQNESKKIAAWGASDGGTSLLYYFDLGLYLSYLIDDNPAKIDTYSPGLHLPVKSSYVFESDPPDIIILLAWRYAEEIIRAHPGYKGIWVLPIPELSIL